MIEAIDPKITDRVPVRCEECDREMDHYNTFVTPTNERLNVCWECQTRRDKGFFAHRGFHRGARNGNIPR
ncbi:MAG TPA: hypothetical protein VMZ26_08960 [Pyrinomonadaceae bacterium]|nr:hypothetical protein [Pyrinomonadaceae bacterium]